MCTSFDGYISLSVEQGVQVCTEGCRAGALCPPCLLNQPQPTEPCDWSEAEPSYWPDNSGDFPWYKGMKRPPSFSIRALFKETLAFMAQFHKAVVKTKFEKLRGKLWREVVAASVGGPSMKDHNIFTRLVLWFGLCSSLHGGK